MVSQVSDVDHGPFVLFENSNEGWGVGHLAYVDRFLSHPDESRITEMGRGVYVAGVSV